MNLHCTDCGSDKIILTDKFKMVPSEMGFISKVHIYRCENCGTEFVICSECEGNGFVESYDDFVDCDICNGFGLIKIENN